MKNDKRVMEGNIDYVCRTMKENLEFLFSRQRASIITSCFGLFDDVLRLGALLGPHGYRTEEERRSMVTKYLMYYVMWFDVLPNTHFICTAILLGALPQAYYTIRLILESLVAALYADSREELMGLGWRKIWHESVKHATPFKVKDSLRNILARAFGDEADEWLNLILDLYQEVSSWVHPIARIRIDGQEHVAGILMEIARAAATRGFPPAYSLFIPMAYTEEDLEDLDRLAITLDRLKAVLAAIVYAWSFDKSFVDREAVKDYLERALT